MDNVKLEPLRTLDDFLLASARFQVPNVSDLDRWANRLKDNLIYYQTNYFFSALVIFLIVGVMHPSQMLLGIIAMVGSYLGCNYVVKHQTVINDFKKKHPMVCLIAIVGAGYLVVTVISSVLVFCFGILLPITAIFVHASLRLRDTKNKLSNLKEKLSLKTTPMGLILEELGMPFEGFAD